MNGPSICFVFFFSSSFRKWQNYCHLMPIFCTFQISSSFFSRQLESFEFTCFPLLPFFLLNNSVMEKMIYNLLLKASNETGDNKDILCTLYNCTFVDWQLHCSNGLKCHTFFFQIKIKSKLVSHFDHISCDFVRLKTGWWHWRKSYMSYFTILSEHGLLFYKIKMTH